MTDAGDKLARSRQAILEHIARRQRRHDPHEEPPSGSAFSAGAAGEERDEPPPMGGGWFGHIQHAVRTWWRYHPAHMVFELAAPFMHDYARRKPVQLLGISLAAGAALTLVRPWRLISLTTLALALVKSAALPRLLMAAMAAADYQKDASRPEWSRDP